MRTVISVVKGCTTTQRNRCAHHANKAFPRAAIDVKSINHSISARVAIKITQWQLEMMALVHTASSARIMIKTALSATKTDVSSVHRTFTKSPGRTFAFDILTSSLEAPSL